MGFKFRRSKQTQPSSQDPDSDDEPMQGRSFKYRVNAGGGGNLQPAGSFDQPHLPQHSGVGGRASSAPRQRTGRSSANQPTSGRRRRASSGRRAAGGASFATKVSTDEQTDVTAQETLGDSSQSLNEGNQSDDDENDAASSSSGGSSNEYNPYIGSKASRGGRQAIPEDEMSYPSVGSQVRTTTRGGTVPAPPGVSPSSRMNGQDDGGENSVSVSSRRSQRRSKRSADSNRPQDAGVNHDESEMKIKPPSARGMAGRVQGKQHRRSRSQGAASSGATVATSRSAPNLDASASSSASVASEGSESTTEVAAMQQLAYLVVSLRSDLKEANEAREELETRVDELESGDFAKGGEGNSVEVKRLEKENADLQADVDAFIAEQDDLKGEMEALKSENERLKSSSSESNSAAAVGSDARINRLEVTNKKLKEEIARLIKLNAGKSSSSAGAPSKELEREVATLKDEVKSKDRVIAEMENRVSELKSSHDKVDSELAKANEAVASLGSDLEERDVEKKSEAAKMTLLRQRLAQVEKQKAELAEKNESLNGAVEGLRNEASGLSEERDAAREELTSARSELERVEGEIEELRDETERLEGELMNQSTSGMSRAGDAARVEELERTVSELRQSVAAQAAVVAQLEETRASLEAMVEATSNELSKSAAQVATLETQLKTYQELSDEISEGTSEETVLKERVMSLASANEILRSKIENLESVKSSSEKKLKDLEESHSSLMSSNRNLENLQAKLEEDRDDAEEEIQEATDAISMLEDELDKKDVQVKDLMVSLDRNIRGGRRFPV